jgi:hypothetical protein
MTIKGIGWAATFGSLGNITYFLWEPDVIKVAGNWPKAFWFFPPFQYVLCRNVGNALLVYVNWCWTFRPKPIYNFLQ